MSLPSTIMGFAFFRMFQDWLRIPFTPAEHATLVVIASSLGLMPFTIGAIGVLPAMEFLTKESENCPFRLSWVRLVWSVGVSILGVSCHSAIEKKILHSRTAGVPLWHIPNDMIGSLHRDETIATRIAQAQSEVSSNHNKRDDAGNFQSNDEDVDDTLSHHD
ncbi:hypothetical protein B0J13DRAFT_626374 [Dactylonectria estremocensis]|uniref:Uncharacterized protein n=1 Tax=Dactylonectria estremocensis TaxID=1079267 RepID=A0A9P9E6I5_9HYPO|nr:hypothetical protein B0J13DRAFT_626374 [Dactylonectria estremocensis]